ncbi:MAG: FkbM family methyltransferase, partial [Pseudomonadota bacterium]
MSLKSKLFGKSSKSDPTRRLFTTLQALGYAPGHIIDIGGNRGDWTRKALEAYPKANVTVFEPQKSLATYHQDIAARSNVEIVYAGVGDQDGEASFTIHDRDDSSSFLYSEEQASDKGFERETMQIHALDTFTKTCQFGAPNMIKIDAEGIDLQVLDGAKETLKGVDLFLIEATIANKDYPNTVLEVLKKAESLGFQLFDITDLNRTPQRGVLWLVELVFVKPGSALDRASEVYA